MSTHREQRPAPGGKAKSGKALTFSIITCTWNSEPYLAQSIQSVLEQDYPHVEYIFVDGGSTDGTLERIRRLERPYRLLENVRGGISNAMNEGIRAATGDVIAHLHSDDYYIHPRVLSTVADALQTQERGWLFGRILRDVDGSLLKENFISPRYSHSRLLHANFIPHPATFVRRDWMNRAGGFSTSLKYAMDYDLWLRLAEMGDPVQLDEPLAAFREHQGSLSTRDRLPAFEEDFRVRKSHLGVNPIARAKHYAYYLVRRHRVLQQGVPA
ncbi:Glycosyltransferase, GT2 family [Noviherbaspirillum humi]|uniref:Glycosyltransferase, GT2 family n=1 Tax=Noviherbaspirillum humi TaxID=1688639 RepID=A0A239GYS5_9BURK|nr:glycosyltransferase family 2 protein [Noviherbaspirillum humi]SNS74359.1 Glycosyltransferase, GT2 family [Noviherbaspirillum humi]